MEEYRIETDFLGRVRVPASANYMLDPIPLTKPGNLSEAAMTGRGVNLLTRKKRYEFFGILPKEGHWNDRLKEGRESQEHVNLFEK